MAQVVESVKAETGETAKTALTIPSNFDWDKLEQATAQPNVAPKYIEFDAVGTIVRGLYLGKSQIEKKEGDSIKIIPVIVLLTKNGAVMNGGVSLYDSVTKFCKEGEAIEIEFTGKKKVGNGNMKEYAVRPLVLNIS